MKLLGVWALFLVITLQQANNGSGRGVRSRKAKPTPTLEPKACSPINSCPSGYCCIGIISSTTEVGVCKPYLSLGDLCIKFLLPGGSTCPCASGLTCMLDMIDKNDTAFHRCEPLEEIIQEGWRR